MIKRVLRIALPILVIGGAITIWASHHSHSVRLPSPSTEDPLKINNDGSQIYTDVTADQLQPAATPARSTTSSDLSPQKAQPNYCQVGEIPIIDGCVQHP